MIYLEFSVDTFLSMSLAFNLEKLLETFFLIKVANENQFFTT